MPLLWTALALFSTVASAIVVPNTPHHFRVIEYMADDESARLACIDFANSLGYQEGYCHRGPAFDYPGADAMWQAGWLRDWSVQPPDFRFYLGDFVFSLPDPKGLGPPEICVGNPIHPGNGNKYQVETDYPGTGAFSTEFKRYYNSATAVFDARMGRKWRHTYDRSIVAQSLNGHEGATVLRPDGRQYFFKLNAALGEWYSQADVVFRLARLTDANNNAIGWRVVSPDDERETYDIDGLLVSIESRDGLVHTLSYDTQKRLTRVEDSTGRGLDFTYDTEGRVDTLTDPGGQLYSYSYGANNTLSGVLYPSGQQRGYLYELTGFPHALTGLVDENNERFASWQYNAKGRSIGSHHFDGVNSYVLSYEVDASNQPISTVTDPLGAERIYTFAIIHGIPRSTGQSQSGGSGCGFATSAKIHDINGNIESSTDFNDVTTFRGHDSRNLEIYRIEAQGRDAQPDHPTSQERKLETDWHPKRRLPIETRSFSCLAPDLTEQPCITAVSERWQLEQLTRYHYNTGGQVVAQCQIDHDGGSIALAYNCGSSTNPPAGVRQTRMTYCEQADVDAPGSTCPILGYRKAIDGPRTDAVDVIQFTYHPATNESGCDTGGTCHRRGDLWTVTNALGHVTEHLRYDRAGRVTRVRDANGVLTDFIYHPRGWLEQRIVRTDGVADAGDATTTFAYTPTGLIERITQPDGDYIDYSYDGAQRLVGIADSLGNHIVYTLDPAGNRIAEETFDPTQALRRRQAREYNALGRLVAERDAIVDAGNPNGRLVAEHGYDGNGNRTHSIDGLGRRSDHEYDPLNRVKKSLDALNPRGIVDYAYDARDHLIQVTDPKGLLTEYVYDGLADLRELRSPDTGTTVYSYDGAGNRISQTDARGVTTQYSYDALNRLTGIQYPSDSSLNVSFVYDTVQPGCGAGETFAIGRLSGVTDPSGSTTLCYDRRGSVTRKSLDDGFGNPLVSRYRYTLGDRLAATIYPSGLEVELQYDSVGRISTLRWRANAAAAWQNLVTGVHYRPFGPLAGFSFGNGRTVSKDYDGNYAIDALASSAADGLNLDFEVDVLGNIVAITPTGANNSEQERRYEYDPLYRLTEVRDANEALIEAFNYDPTGNRTSKQVGTNPAQPYDYPVDSHRLTSVDGLPRTYDNAGNLNSVATPDFFGSTSYNHGAHNRLISLWQSGDSLASYVYNGQGERACKWLGTDPIRYVYDTGGRLLGEYAASGKPLFEYVYLDTLPVAVFTAAGLAYIETDHLGTPRVVIDAGSDQALWRWPLTGSAFGEHAPDEDVDNTGKNYIFNLRFPGQYFDAESGLHYNYFRDYEPGTGRYIQSDPMGLKDGPSTFSYVWGSPLGYFDIWGLYRICYRTSRPHMVYEIGHGIVPWGWEPYQRSECISLPEPCPPLDCGDDGYPRECELEARRCRDRWGKGAGAVSVISGLVGFSPLGNLARYCAGGISISATFVGFLTGHCDDAERACRKRCTEQCR